MTEFQPPRFDDGTMEVRVVNGEVAIYASPEGLARIAQLCSELTSTCAAHSTAHVHLEDYGLLTKDSLPCVIAVLRNT